jgi:hypothetical protein
MKEKVLQLLIDKHIKSGGHNGYYLPKLISDAESNYNEVRKAISEIHKDGLLKTADGAHGVLILYKPPTK